MSTINTGNTGDLLLANLANTTTYTPWITNGTIGTDICGNIYYDQNKITNPLKELYYNVEFEFDKDCLLSSNITSIRKNKFVFNCNYVGNRIQPYELIMKLINDKKTFSVKIKVSDILTISYVNFRFTEIENNLNFNSNCDFSKIKVRFKCDKILYENHRLSEKELRADKLKKIIENN